MKIPGYVESVERARKEGKAAKTAGVEFRLCPYTPGSFLYKAWTCGWAEEG